MATTPIRPYIRDDTAHVARKRIGFEVSEELYAWLRVQADSREQSLASYLRVTLHAIKRRQELQS